MARKAQVVLTKDEQRAATIASIAEFPSETKVKAWTFTMDKKIFTIATYTVWKGGDFTAIWECTKRGKRLSKEPLYFMNGIHPAEKCLNLYLDSLELAEIDAL